MLVRPILSTTVDWHTYLLAAKSALGRSITSKSDEQGIKANTLSAFIASLGAFKRPKESPVEIISNAGDLLNHSFFGFLVICPASVLFSLLESTPLSVLSADAGHNRIAIVSGTLAQWYTALKTSNQDILPITNECMRFFESLGVGTIWRNYTKVALQNELYFLREKQ